MKKLIAGFIAALIVVTWAHYIIADVELQMMLELEKIGAKKKGVVC